MDSLFENMRCLDIRRPASCGVVVDAEGAMLGLECALVQRTAAGYHCLGPAEAAAIQKALFVGRYDDADLLFTLSRGIAKALNEGNMALAQIYGLRIPTTRLDGQQLKRLADAASFIKANFNPDEPRVPAGESGGGQWTNESNSSTVDTEPSPHHPTGDGSVEIVAYPGDYHDAVAQALKNYLIDKGGKVITGIALNAINGTTAVADMIVRLPGAAPFIVEVKTGPGAQFTDPQMSVYPMAQVGGHVSSLNSALRDVGLTPGKLLPPLDVYIYWVRVPGTRGEFIKLPPPQLFQ